MGIVQIGFSLLAVYGIFAMSAFIVLRQRTKQELLAGMKTAVAPELLQKFHGNGRYSRGLGFSQIASFVLSCVLLLTAIYLAMGLTLSKITYDAHIELRQFKPVDDFQNFYNSSVFLVGFVLLLLIPIVIGINAAWIYSAKVRRAETAALFTGKGAFVFAQKTLALIVWGIYTILACVIAIASTASALSMASVGI